MLRCLCLCGLLALGVVRPASAQVMIGTPAELVSLADYPAESLARREEGLVNLSFGIAPDGTARDCTIVYASAPQRLRKLSCTLVIARARYKPARDEAGIPIAAEDRLVIRWQARPATAEAESQFGGAIPLSPPQDWLTDNDYSKVSQGRRDVDVDMRFRIGSDGRIESCTASAGVTGIRTCALLTARARFRQPRGERGEALATSGHLVMHWR